MIKFTKYKDDCNIYLYRYNGPCFGSGSDLGICGDMNKGWIGNGNLFKK